MKELPICAECGEREEDHGHQFVPMFAPDGCVCEPMEWGDPGRIPKVCRVFRPLPAPDADYCKECEHEKPCHANRDREEP